MTEEVTPNPLSPEPSQANLKELAASLRQAEHLDANTQKLLASLLDELSTELAVDGPATARTARLTAAVAEVARALHRQDPAEEFGTARESLEEAAAHAEVESPVATGIAYRVLDLLASIGI